MCDFDMDIESDVDTDMDIDAQTELSTDSCESMDKMESEFESFENVGTEKMEETDDFAKILKRDMDSEILESRWRDTEEVLDNYRENLKDYGVEDEEAIESFLNQEREKMYAEYDSLNSGNTSTNIYYAPTEWKSIAESMKNKENPASFSENLEDAELFDKNEAGEYTYLEDEHGKTAFGNLEMADEIERNSKAQREVGGLERRDDDDGGHLIGARFGGSPEMGNLDAQNSNLNRGTYKKLENSWAKELEDENQVFAEVNTYKSNGSDRPDAYMGYTISESPDGKRHWNAFSFQNENAEIQEQWEREIEELEGIQEESKF